jgi:hypothetical protein
LVFDKSTVLSGKEFNVEAKEIYNSSWSRLAAASPGTFPLKNLYSKASSTLNQRVKNFILPNIG